MRREISPRRVLPPLENHISSTILVEYLYSSHLPMIQTKLQVNQPGDVYEKEAEQVVEQVMRMTVIEPPVSDSEDEAKNSLMRKQGRELGARSTTESCDLPPVVHTALSNGEGQPMDATTRAYMEPRFGHDFSQVRIHTQSPTAEAAQALQARAFTVGQDVVLGANENNPGSSRYRQLLAHELVHTIQQRPDSSAHRFVQRQPKSAETDSGDMAKAVSAIIKFSNTTLGPSNTRRGVAWMAARSKIVTSINQLKAKYGLGDVSEEHGAEWSVSELVKIDTAFAKMSKDEKAMLKGAFLVRSDKESDEIKGKKIQLAGLTGATTIRLYNLAFPAKNTAATITITLHEAGHLIRNRVNSEIVEKGRIDLVEAHKKFDDAVSKTSIHENNLPSIQAFIASMNKVMEACTAFQKSKKANRETMQSMLDSAQADCEINRLPVAQLQNDPAARACLEAHDRLTDMVIATEHWVDENAKALEPTEHLTEFVELVKKHKLAHKGFAPFTDYVASKWPEKPGEFFAESYSTWRTNPNYIKTHAKALFDWFEGGGHLR